jgi:2'-5' RNA ligase superfamily
VPAARVQARITLPETLRAPIDALRMRWNPEIAAGNPAHATLVYHDEAPDPELLRARLEAACAVAAPFRLELAGPARFRGARGAFLQVRDPGAGARGLRERALGPPFLPRGRFGLHVTLLHPAQGERLEEAWPALAALAAPGSFLVESIDLITGGRPGIRVLAHLALRGSPAPRAEI